MFSLVLHSLSCHIPPPPPPQPPGTLRKVPGHSVASFCLQTGPQPQKLVGFMSIQFVLGQLLGPLGEDDSTYILGPGKQCFVTSSFTVLIPLPQKWLFSKSVKF